MNALPFSLDMREINEYNLYDTHSREENESMLPNTNNERSTCDNSQKILNARICSFSTDFVPQEMGAQ